MKQGDMLEVLRLALAAIGSIRTPWTGDRPGLLEDGPENWNTLDVDYEPPHVERLWRPFLNNYRVYLHRIHPCETALFHPHPWPSAIAVLSGVYEMQIGHSATDVAPEVTTTLMLAKHSSYEMIHPDGWHSVRPIGDVSYSVMVTGPSWKRWSPKATHELKPLSKEVARDILNNFRYANMRN